MKVGKVLKNTPENRKRLEEEGFGDRNFNWEQKKGSYFVIVSSDAYLLIKKKDKLILDLEKAEAKETKKRKKWHKYEDAGCGECEYTGVYKSRHGSGATAYVDKKRCNCTYNKTLRYFKALQSDDISLKKYQKKLEKFIDNNEHIKNEYGIGA